MKKKNEIVTRESVEKKIKYSIEHPSIPTYDWMYHLGLTPTQRDVYALIFDKCKATPMQEVVINTKELAKKFDLTVSQLNNTTRVLHDNHFIYKRTESNKTYYSLYPNLLSA